MTHASRIFVHVADHCQYGRRWRMTTGFIWSNIDERDTAFEPQLPCSRTHLPHLSLTCRNPRKVLWWTIARNRHNCFNKVSRTCTFVPLHPLISVHMFCDLRWSTAIICANVGILCMSLETFSRPQCFRVDPWLIAAPQCRSLRCSETYSPPETDMSSSA